ncbi:hypothetical protein C1637_00765 [Chryseobacterium lactis]|uniref:DUF4377 domain-containing protein n=1 Tax=Chryseobacterium lactis TaxID=1241981 RepID=A0A3G6RMM3_CHRLC|nr:hypothetical protein [Chryseobacterium lactis]AZA81144.1 hypothetical protein EG342_04150 [Chryseobacterium lactis]AZB06145.1 hypothetical protein EG341_20275 [Chryseobacterium lactis]PNW14995.1 hypothetical protein C1637_00765 [Chryseobacterium lactis]
MYKLLLGILPLLFVGCKKEKAVEKEIVKTIDNTCYSSDFMEKILNLEEIKSEAKFLESETKGKGKIGFLVDSTKVNNGWDYSISVGYNGPDRFETYHIFQASSDQCNSLKIMEPVSGDYISIEKWRQMTNESVQPESGLKKGKYNLPIESLPRVDVKFLETDFLPEGSQQYTCGELKFRYFPLTPYKGMDLILVPMDCGDFDYRYYLLTVVENKIVGELYVEGIWFDPGKDDKKEEFSSYEISKSGKVTVTTDHTLDGESQSITNAYYQISDDGKIIEIKK